METAGEAGTVAEGGGGHFGAEGGADFGATGVVTCEFRGQSDVVALIFGDQFLEADGV